MDYSLIKYVCTKNNQGDFVDRAEMLQEAVFVKLQGL